MCPIMPPACLHLSAVSCCQAYAPVNAQRVVLLMCSQTRSSNPGKGFESVELGELDKQQREKVPRRIIHFSSGETMEEYSTDEEEEEDREPERKDLLSPQVDAVRRDWECVAAK